MSKSITLAAVGLSCLLAIPLLFSCQKSNPNKSGTKTDTTGGNSTGIDTTPQKKYYVTTLAGTGQAGFVNGPDTLAQFNNPVSIAVDNQGNIFVGDQANFSIRKITAAGEVSTFAGASVNTQPVYGIVFGLATDQQGDLFAPDSYSWVREITPAGVNIDFAGKDSIGFRDGSDTNALFHALGNIAIDRQNNLYLVDYDLNFLFHLRKITPAGVVTTLSLQDNTGINSDAVYNNPGGAGWNAWLIAVDSVGNLYVSAGELRSSIKKITPAGIVSLYAGQATYGQVDGGKDSAKFYDISGLAIDSYGNLLVTEGSGNDVRKVTPNGTVSTIAGIAGYAAFADGEGSNAWFNYPSGIVVDRQGIIYVTDYHNQRIRKIVYR
jgi:hypothetical protein